MGTTYEGQRCRSGDAVVRQTHVRYCIVYTAALSGWVLILKCEKGRVPKKKGRGCTLLNRSRSLWSSTFHSRTLGLMVTFLGRTLAMCQRPYYFLGVCLQDEIPQKSTTYHSLPQEGTDCAVCSQTWSPNSCAFLCNIFDLYHAQSSRRYFDRKYFIRRMRFLFAKLALCVPPFCREYTHIAPRQKPRALGML